MNDPVERTYIAWLREGPDRGPEHGLERALAAARRTPQRPGWTFGQGTTALRLGAIAAVVILAVTVGAGLVTRPGGVAGPAVPGATATPSPAPSVATPSPVPSVATPAPLVPATPLPDPAGSALPSSLFGRQYSSNPPEFQGTQELVLTLRAADDPHCLAMFDGRSTCFTILWTPNYPKHQTDPGVRGPARIVAGQLVLGFAIVPSDPVCQGTSSTYAIEDDGATLRGVDVPACSFQAFTQR